MCDTDSVTEWDELSDDTIRMFALATLLDIIDKGHYDYWSDDRTAMKRRAIRAFDPPELGPVGEGIISRREIEAWG